jgi:hypothetical protein
MAEEFDYGALWSIAQDALNEVNALTGAILQLPSAPLSPWAIHNPPRGAHEKWQAKLKTLPERRARAADAIRKAAEKLAKLLVEDRFIAPVAGVWPPSAPEIARRVSSGLGMAAGAARAVIAWKDDAHIGQFKSSAVSAQSMLQAVIAELERRADVAELAYQGRVEKLRAEHPDWSGADSAVKAVGGKFPEEPAGDPSANWPGGQGKGATFPKTVPAGPARVKMTMTDVGRYIGVGPKTVSRWIRDGKLTATDEGGRQSWYLQHELDTLKASRQKKTEP